MRTRLRQCRRRLSKLHRHSKTCCIQAPPDFPEGLVCIINVPWRAYAVPETAGTDGKERENYVYHNGEIPTDDGQEILAEVPMAEISDYAITLRSMTQGRGSFESAFERYEDAPPAVQEKVIEAAQAQ